ncbi:hypothetical protein AWC30_06855 [Mycolicibacillus trivialis]|uniref:Uncharacterized protein n=2 Tax=Mycolicibacillus trivialis TaxID=1798 RepID=A0A1X2ELS4_9MYCO|nr:hypothetical protein [Mycolicibacillus trivialis]ORX06122.1 hypothetical protein AWC30_06855 [Mycolicibacillus trivialis]
MTGPYPYPGFGPPVRRLPIWLPGALVGSVALVGLLATLFPVWVVDVGEDYLLGPGEEGLGGTVVVTLDFYSWVASAVPVFGLIPLALAAAVAVAATQLVRGVDRGLWGGDGGIDDDHRRAGRDGGAAANPENRDHRGVGARDEP